jgi:hypothetical protein
VKLLGKWKRGWDLNPRPPGYEPDELTGLLYPAIKNPVACCESDDLQLFDGLTKA